MIGREDALRALREAGCSKEVIWHCLAVERTALSIAKQIRTNGHKIDLKLVSRGALLHDIGRTKTHGIMHGVEGARILRNIGLRGFVRFAECHLGAGIPASEAKELGLPARDFIPRTLEEKVVTYADKLAMGRRRTSYERALEWFRSELGPKHPAVERFKKLHLEIENLCAKK
ncbi:MAG: TIGR00295 family protein [Candidatus Hodarchaeaceae archaeon]|nr:TIGR00295 family protein [Candidatus Hodarchaeaceae archaeon]